MIIASAQTSPKQGDIESNLIDHYNMIDLASKNRVNLIVFPEMSITGYEREKARDLAFTVTDSRLERLRQLSIDKKMTLIVGAPVLLEDNLYIGALVIKPDYSISMYTKQYLHSGEEEFFDPSFEYNPLIHLNNEQISVAICADIVNSKHAAAAKKIGATLYIASIFFSPTGIAEAHKTLSEYAKQQSMNVLMSNYCGRSWGLDSGGKSAFWDKNGDLIVNLDDIYAGLLIVENTDNKWIGKTLSYE
ncbi:MAG: carbon-nitrogen hydrolase family protein [Cyclobacteriaceae bacterium]|nr:carbon-nitrogen hydrolase family protein [Cyclobacteriaceae bacterium]